MSAEDELWSSKTGLVLCVAAPIVCFLAGRWVWPLGLLALPATLIAISRVAEEAKIRLAIWDSKAAYAFFAVAAPILSVLLALLVMNARGAVPKIWGLETVFTYVFFGLPAIALTVGTLYVARKNGILAGFLYAFLVGVLLLYFNGFALLSGMRC